MNTQIDLSRFRAPVKTWIEVNQKIEHLSDVASWAVGEGKRLLSIIDNAAKVAHEISAPTGRTPRAWTEKEKTDRKAAQQPAAVVDDGGLSRSLKLAAAEQQAEAWQAVCSLLDEIRPGWLIGNGSGITRALAAIRELSFPVEDAAVAVDDVMVERACRAYFPGWETSHPEAWKAPRRLGMRVAITAGYDTACMRR